MNGKQKIVPAATKASYISSVSSYTSTSSCASSSKRDPTRPNEDTRNVTGHHHASVLSYAGQLSHRVQQDLITQRLLATPQYTAVTGANTSTHCTQKPEEEDTRALSVNQEIIVSNAESTSSPERTRDTCSATHGLDKHLFTAGDRRILETATAQCDTGNGTALATYTDVIGTTSDQKGNLDLTKAIRIRDVDAHVNIARGINPELDTQRVREFFMDTPPGSTRAASPGDSETDTDHKNFLNRDPEALQKKCQLLQERLRQQKQRAWAFREEFRNICKRTEETQEEHFKLETLLRRTIAQESQKIATLEMENAKKVKALIEEKARRRRLHSALIEERLRNQRLETAMRECGQKIMASFANLTSPGSCASYSSQRERESAHLDPTVQSCYLPPKTTIVEEELRLVDGAANEDIASVYSCDERSDCQESLMESVPDDSRGLERERDVLYMSGPGPLLQNHHQLRTLLSAKRLSSFPNFTLESSRSSSPSASSSPRVLSSKFQQKLTALPPATASQIIEGISSVLERFLVEPRDSKYTRCGDPSNAYWSRNQDSSFVERKRVDENNTIVIEDPSEGPAFSDCRMPCSLSRPESIRHKEATFDEGRLSSEDRHLDNTRHGRARRSLKSPTSQLPPSEQQRGERAPFADKVPTALNRKRSLQGSRDAGFHSLEDGINAVNEETISLARRRRRLLQLQATPNTASGLPDAVGQDLRATQRYMEALRDCHAKALDALRTRTRMSPQPPVKVSGVTNGGPIGQSTAPNSAVRTDRRHRGAESRQARSPSHIPHRYADWQIQHHDNACSGRRTLHKTTASLSAPFTTQESSTLPIDARKSGLLCKKQTLPSGSPAYPSMTSTYHALATLRSRSMRSRFK